MAPAKKSKSKRRRTVTEFGPDPVDVHVGGRMRQARFSAGLSQDEVGAGIGVSFQAVQKYEKGENRLSASRLYAAAQLLKVRPSYFFDGLDGSRPMASAGDLDRREFDLIRSLRRITDESLRSSLEQVILKAGRENDDAE